MLIILSGRETWRLSVVYVLLDLLVGFTDTELATSHKRFFNLLPPAGHVMHQ